MVEFHKLTVTEIHKTIRDAVVLTLKPQITGQFEFVQGQYLTFRHDFDGQELRRSYSICSSKDDDLLQVGIKRVDGGVFSTWVNSELKVGDVVEAMPPMGNFYAKQNIDNTHYITFAGGSGITPIISIIKTGLMHEPDARFTLIYANKNPNTIMFREELEDIKNYNMGRFNVIHILEDESQDIDLFYGRVDGKKCKQLFDTWVDIETISMAYICGPEPMMLSISDALKEHGLEKNQIRFELFTSRQSGRAKKKAVSATSNEKGIPGLVTIGGETRSITVLPNTSLLEASVGNKLDAPFACKAGVCSTCKAKVLKGAVEMIANHALEDYEVEAGYVLTCQSYPVSDEVVWDYDQAGH